MLPHLLHVTPLCTHPIEHLTIWKLKKQTGRCDPKHIRKSASFALEDPRSHLWRAIPKFVANLRWNIQCVHIGSVNAFSSKFLTHACNIVIDIFEMRWAGEHIWHAYQIGQIWETGHIWQTLHVGQVQDTHVAPPTTRNSLMHTPNRASNHLKT